MVEWLSPKQQVAGSSPAARAVLTNNIIYYKTMGFIGKIKKFSKEVSVEMKKVTWPTKEQLKESTKVVVAISLIFVAFTFIVDQIVTEIMKLIY